MDRVLCRLLEVLASTSLALQAITAYAALHSPCTPAGSALGQQHAVLLIAIY